MLYFIYYIESKFGGEDQQIEFSTSDGIFCITKEGHETKVYAKGNEQGELTNNQYLSILKYFVKRMIHISHPN